MRQRREGLRMARLLKDLTRLLMMVRLLYLENFSLLGNIGLQLGGFAIMENGT